MSLAALEVSIPIFWTNGLANLYHCKISTYLKIIHVDSALHNGTYRCMSLCNAKARYQTGVCKNSMVCNNYHRDNGLFYILVCSRTKAKFNPTNSIITEVLTYELKVARFSSH